MKTLVIEMLQSMEPGKWHRLKQLHYKEHKFNELKEEALRVGRSITDTQIREWYNRGKTSLIFYLWKKGYVNRMRQGRIWLYSLTPKGEGMI